jgi:CBS domain-containing membrane protein
MRQTPAHVLIRQRRRTIHLTGRRRNWRLFAPILAGATARDRALACLGAFAGVGLVALASTLAHGGAIQIPWLVAPIGASAVLLFAVPASPMAQPWPTVGGNVLSAAVGLLVMHVVKDRTLAAGIAVGLAIGLMSVSRCLHPPGGAAALTVVLGGHTVTSAGDLFPLAPLGMNAVALVIAGWAFHKLSGHSYPHTAPSAAVGVPSTTDLPASRRVGFRAEDIDAVLTQTSEAFDISREDLDLLLHKIETQALVREHGDLTCAEIMSRDVISVHREDPPSIARRLLIDAGVRLLPVLDSHGRVVGAVGLRELEGDGRTVGDLMTDPLTTMGARPAIELTGPLTDGRRHAAIVVDADRRLVGLVSQSDLLAAVTRSLSLS